MNATPETVTTIQQRVSSSPGHTLPLDSCDTHPHVFGPLNGAVSEFTAIAVNARAPLDRVFEDVRDARMRRKLFVDNPAKLYGAG